MKLKLLSVWWYGWVLTPRPVNIQMVAFGRGVWRFVDLNRLEIVKPILMVYYDRSCGGHEE